MNLAFSKRARFAGLATTAAVTLVATVGLPLASSSPEPTLQQHSAPAADSEQPVSATARKSTALTQAPDIQQQPQGVAAVNEQVKPSELAAVAEKFSNDEIPLAPGLNSAAALNWEKQVGDGTALAPAEIRHLLQFNAARDWLWYAAHNELTAEQRQIVTDIPNWSAFRSSGVRDHFVSVIVRILGGDKAFAVDFAASQFPDHGGAPPSDARWAK